VGRQNILFIVTDQHALHAVSCYGPTACRTPAIDALAADGVRFTRAYTPCGLCTPARASMLTGVYPHTHGAKYNTGTHQPFGEDQCGVGLGTYPQKLAEMGYRLGYQGKWHAGIAETCHDLGFEGFGPRGYGRVSTSPDWAGYLAERGLSPEPVIEFYAAGDGQAAAGDASGYRTGPAAGSPSHFLAHKTVEMLREYGASAQPFFMACNFWGPHAPYLPTEDYKDMVDPAAIEPWASFTDALADKPMVHRKYRTSVFPAAARADWATWSRIIARYYAQTAMIDAAIGQILDALKEMGLYDDTLIVFTSDHGDTCGVHGGAFDKGAMAYEEVYHIPMIVKMPGSAHAGQTRDKFVSLLDLPETFCQAAGTSMGPTHGQSLLALIDDAAAPWRDDLLAEYHGHRVPVAQRILWHGDHKFIMNYADRDELYDLSSDPAELTNLIDDPARADLLGDLRGRMLDTTRRFEDQPGPQSVYFFTRPL